MLQNKAYRLRTRPQGTSGHDHFEFVSEPVGKPRSGEVLVKVLYLSLDPTNRIWMSDIPQYMEPVKVGEVMRGLGIGRVESSQSPSLKEGDLVSGLLGWQE